MYVLTSAYTSTDCNTHTHTRSGRAVSRCSLKVQGDYDDVFVGPTLIAIIDHLYLTSHTAHLYQNTHTQTQSDHVVNDLGVTDLTIVHFKN